MIGEIETPAWQVKKEAWKVFVLATKSQWSDYLDSTKRDWDAYKAVCESVGLKSTRGGY